MTFNGPIDALQHDITLLHGSAFDILSIASLDTSKHKRALHKISSHFPCHKLAGKFALGSQRPASGCWIWTGSILPNGYGQVFAGNWKVSAHRLGYVLAYGPIPKGLELDHLCRNRSCCRPDHLEPVTRRENIRRGREARIDEFCARNKSRAEILTADGRDFVPAGSSPDFGGPASIPQLKSVVKAPEASGATAPH